MDTIPVLYVNPQQEQPLATDKLYIFLAIKVPQVFLKAQVLQLRSVLVELKQAIGVNGKQQIPTEGVINTNSYTISSSYRLRETVS
ncbi:hypothetical protein D778_02658 [Xanthomarina gelatinilytica]|uniref:Uncharacterized protein n=1 Tax=Xanthomarina gelatinilytica TaxID=1137281 RepID=M7MJX1_9FLAO|nr:hypothetical protein [Xanthomarina gelatinilytica]EMQ95356.1 hypothetical protein D778_02658 [Xanthomarina gelatinilytica]